MSRTRLDLERERERRMIQAALAYRPELHGSDAAREAEVSRFEGEVERLRVIEALTIAIQRAWANGE